MFLIFCLVFSIRICKKEGKQYFYEGFAYFSISFQVIIFFFLIILYQNLQLKSNLKSKVFGLDSHAPVRHVGFRRALTNSPLGCSLYTTQNLRVCTGAYGLNRTDDLRFTRPLLCQLSYAGIQLWYPSPQSHAEHSLVGYGSRNRARTCDPLVNSQLLYLLSYPRIYNVGYLQLHVPPTGAVTLIYSSCELQVVAGRGLEPPTSRL